MKRRTMTMAVAGLLVLTGCAGGDDLAGTTWLGGNIMDSAVSLSFSSGGVCQLKTSYMGSGACTYTAGSDEVTITFDHQTYAFERSANQMVGNLFGAGVSLVKQ